MTAEELLRTLSQVAFVVIAVAVTVSAVRRPRVATVHTAIFFALAALIISAGRVAQWSGQELPAPGTRTLLGMLVAMPYVLLLLADDFIGVPRALMASTFALFLVAAGLALIAPIPLPAAYALLFVAYMVAMLLYSTARFFIASRSLSGVSRRRLEAVAGGGALLAMALLFSGLGAAFPDQRSVWRGISSATSFACGVTYMLGFVPPSFVRNAWRAPLMQRFFAESTQVPRGTILELTTALEERMVSMLATQHAAIALWDEATGRLEAPGGGGAAEALKDRHSSIAYRAYSSQTAVFVGHAGRADPANAAVYQQFGARSIVAAPITIGERRYGVLTAYGGRPPLFADDELEVVQILANQVAILLRDFELTNDFAAYRGHQEAMRLKEDFLSAAAHDLKTPLTALTAQSQLMQRRALREPGRPIETEEVELVVNETRRMRRIVDTLLDAASGDQLGFVGQIEEVDLYALVSEVIASTSTGRTVHCEGVPVMVKLDVNRMRQVVGNLFDNAVKYSPNGGDIDFRVTADERSAILHVSDHGIGISPEDLPIIFERFRRAPSVRYSPTTGLGLGLYLSRRIVEDHGGQIEVKSVLGRGSTFEVRLPRVRRLAAAGDGAPKSRVGQRPD